LRRLAWILVAATSGGAASIHAQQPLDDASAARIRTSLERPPALTITEPKADFHIEIHDHERERWMKFFETPLWQQEKQWRPNHWVAPDAFGATPLFSVDLLAIGQAMAHEVSEYRHARAQREAVDEVHAAIAAYCAQNAGTAPELCK
jgi:hypothetical protein